MAVNEREQETNIYNDNYRTQYPPAEVGESAFRRATSRNLEEARVRSQQAQSSYSDMYNRSRQGSYLNQMAGAPRGFTGGMRNQYDTARSAAEMQAMNQIGVNQERALRDIELNRLAMDRQAVQEGFQAEDRARQTTAYNMQLEQQRQAILADENMTDDQKMRMMMSSGMDYATAAAQVQPASQAGFGQRLVAGEVSPTALGLAAGGALTVGGATIASLPTTSKLAGLMFSSTTRAATMASLKKASVGSIFKGSVSLYGKGSGALAGKTVAKTGGKLATKFASTLPKVSGVLAKFAVAHPFIAVGLAAAAAIGLVYTGYKMIKTPETPAPNYYNMATG